MQIVADRPVNVPRYYPVAVATYGWRSNDTSSVLKNAPGAAPVEAQTKLQNTPQMGSLSVFIGVHLKSPGTKV